MQKIDYGGWNNCYRISNDTVDLVVTTDVGPRIMRFGFIDGPNMLKEFPLQLGVTNSDRWLSFGGHRLWHTPEDKNRTYYPDSKKIDISFTENKVILDQYIEPNTQIKKSIEIQLDAQKPLVSITHRLTNHGAWPIETSAWGITVMAQGGRAIIPLPPRGSHPENLLPTSTLSLWAYTDLSDERWQFGKEFIFLKQDPKNNIPQKIGLFTGKGWIAYQNFNSVFVKYCAATPAKNYPDMGANFEVFTNSEIMELESLSPIKKINPGESIVHNELWLLKNNIPDLVKDEDVQIFLGNLERDFQII